MVNLQLFFDGLAMGLVFVMLAAGLVLIMSVSKILFMAYGVFYTIGAYVTWYAMTNFDLPYFLALIIGVLVSGLLGAISYLLILRPLKNTAGAFLATLIASMGLLMILEKVIVLIFGTMPRKIPAIFPGVLEFGGITILTSKVFLIIAGVAVTVALFLIYEKTSLGRSMRTVAFSPEVASLQGIRVGFIYTLTLGLGAALAGVAGGLLGTTYAMSTSMGANVLWTVMLMTMLGGADSLLGAVAGGALIGQMLSFGQFYLGSIVQLYVFLFVFVFLYFRRNGLLGRGLIIEVK